jgi:hypothetical protein
MFITVRAAQSCVALILQHAGARLFPDRLRIFFPIRSTAN